MADGPPRVFVYSLPPHLNTAAVERHPSQKLDFWYVEHLFHRNLLDSPARTEDPEEADYFLIPFYPACYFAAYAYDEGINLEKWTRLERYRSEFHVLRGFREALRIVRDQPSWRRTGGRRHLLVFGQGRGANAGYIWRFYKKAVSECTFLGVEAKPWGNLAAFRAGHDVVIPGYTPWRDVIDEVSARELPRSILIHFRGRPWGKVRPEIFRNLRSAPDVVLEQETKFALGGENRSASREDAVAYFTELRQTVFCLCPAGWTPWSKRIYETILCGAIPVFIPGTFVPPFPHRIDFSRFSITIGMEDLPSLEQKLRSIPQETIHEMLAEVARIRHHFLWSEQSAPGDAFHLTLDSLRDALRA